MSQKWQTKNQLKIKHKKWHQCVIFGSSFCSAVASLLSMKCVHFLLHRHPASCIATTEPHNSTISSVVFIHFFTLKCTYLLFYPSHRLVFVLVFKPFVMAFVCFISILCLENDADHSIPSARFSSLRAQTACSNAQFFIIALTVYRFIWHIVDVDAEHQWRCWFNYLDGFCCHVSLSYSVSGFFLHLIVIRSA